MDFLHRSLTQYSTEALLFLCASVLLLAGWTWSANRRQSATLVRMREILKTQRGRDLEDLLYEHLTERKVIQSEMAALKKRVNQLEKELATSKRHLGLVRYDAFEDVGGNQSFALALFDDEGNGLVLNGIAGRMDCRFFCKPLVNGRSDRKLSQEEQRAVREAKDLGPKTVVSH